MRQATLIPSRWIHHLSCTDDRAQSITHDQFYGFQPALPQPRQQLFIVSGGFRRSRPPVQDLESAAFPHSHRHQQYPFAPWLRNAAPIPQVNPVHHDGTIAPRRNRFPAPLLDLLLRVLQHRSDGGWRQRPAQKPTHPTHHLALTQSTHRQSEQHLVQTVPLIALHQPDLFPPAHPRNTHLLQTPPQRRPTLPHRVTPTVDFLSPLPSLVHTPVPLCQQQSLHSSLEHPPRLLFHLLPGLFHQFLQCYSSF